MYICDHNHVLHLRDFYMYMYYCSIAICMLTLEAKQSHCICNRFSIDASVLKKLTLFTEQLIHIFP